MPGDDLMDLFVPAAAGECSGGELLAVMLAVPLGVLLGVPLWALACIAWDLWRGKV